MNKKQYPNKRNNLFIYGICLIISLLFFFLFSYNSPLYYFNHDVDYQWYTTVGHGLVQGKIPYRDIFEHKGPIVYFISGFCCLFPSPAIVMLLIESVLISFFFYFAYLICRKYLSTFYSIVAIPILAFTVFSSWTRFGHGAIVEEYCLPFLTYFLLHWLEFILEEKEWNWKTTLLIGVCISFCFWTKLTIISFFIGPMLIWLIINLLKKSFLKIFKCIAAILTGFIIVTVPIIIFYAFNHALDDLWFAYFIFNITVYPSSSLKEFFLYLKDFINIGPALSFFILYGVIKFTLRHWKDDNGQLLISFLVSLFITTWTCKSNYYYNNILMPYAILGIIEGLVLASSLIKLPFKNNSIFFVLFSLLCISITIPFTSLPRERNNSKNDYVPIVISDIISEYKDENHPNTSIFYYKIADVGIHNLTGILPNNYYFAMNYISEEQFPDLFQAINTYITNQTSDFVITDLSIWESEYSFLSRYYLPYTGNIKTSTFNYYNGISGYNLVLLFKKTN